MKSVPILVPFSCLATCTVKSTSMAHQLILHACTHRQSFRISWLSALAFLKHVHFILFTIVKLQIPVWQTFWYLMFYGKVHTVLNWCLTLTCAMCSILCPHHWKSGGKGIQCYPCPSIHQSLSASEMALAICVLSFSGLSSFHLSFSGGASMSFGHISSSVQNVCNIFEICNAL